MSRNFFIGFGIFFTLNGGMFVSLGWYFESNNAETGYSLLALAFVLFVNAYLFPQIRKNDERAKYIRQKAIFYSYFCALAYIIILSSLASIENLPFTTYETLALLTTAMIVTPSTIMLILAKRM